MSKILSRQMLRRRIARSKAAREQLVTSHLAKCIAFQIAATRQRQNLSQEQLATLCGMRQSNLTRLEDPTYGKQTISSLKRIADALDVALEVRLVPFSQYINWIEKMDSQSLAVPNYDEDHRTT